MTIIHLWDKGSSYLLSSRNNTPKIERGEPGIDEETRIILTSSTSSTLNKLSPLKREKSDGNDVGFEPMKISVVDMEKNTGKDGKKKNVATEDDLMPTNCPLAELFTLIMQHQKIGVSDGDGDTYR